MTSGLPNSEKAQVRQLYAEGKVGRDELLDAEAAVLPRPRHLHVLRHRELQPAPGGGDGPAPARRQLRQPGHPAARGAHRRGRPPRHGAHRARRRYTRSARSSTRGRSSTACVALLATGGSTNHTMHLVAIAAAAGIALTWDDFADLSAVVPLLARDLPQRRGRHQPLPRRGRHRRSSSASCSTPASCTPTCRPWPGTGCDRYSDGAEARRRAADAGADGAAAQPRRPTVLRPADDAVRARRRAPRARPATSAAP